MRRALAVLLLLPLFLVVPARARADGGAPHFGPVRRPAAMNAYLAQPRPAVGGSPQR